MIYFHTGDSVFVVDCLARSMVKGKPFYNVKRLIVEEHHFANDGEVMYKFYKDDKFYNECCVFDTLNDAVKYIKKLGNDPMWLLEAVINTL